MFSHYRNLVFDSNLKKACCWLNQTFLDNFSTLGTTFWYFEYNLILSSGAGSC